MSLLADSTRRIWTPSDDCNACVGPPRCAFPKRIVDYASSGPDEYLQGWAADPYQSINRMGLRIPGASTITASTPGNADEGPPLPGGNGLPLASRYLFSLCTVQIGHARRRLVGLGQYLKLGFLQTNGNGSRPIECEVITPDFRLDNADVSWHLMVHSTDKLFVGNRDSDSNASGFTHMGLNYLSESYAATDLNVYGRPDYYTTLTGYIPPNNGKPYGSALIPALGCFYDIRFPWNYGDCFGNIDFEVEGPCTVTFFASVRQRDTTAPIPAASAVGSPIATGFGGPEEAYLQNFPNAVYWAIGGRMIWEDAECSSGDCDIHGSPGGRTGYGGGFGGGRGGGGGGGGGGKQPPTQVAA